MPVTSRRCGLITKREAERLVRSFIADVPPPRLPDDFTFRVRVQTILAECYDALFVVTIQSLSLRWVTADAEITVPSAENPELSNLCIVSTVVCVCVCVCVCARARPRARVCVYVCV